MILFQFVAVALGRSKPSPRGLGEWHNDVRRVLVILDLESGHKVPPLSITPVPKQSCSRFSLLPCHHKIGAKASESFSGRWEILRTNKFEGVAVAPRVPHGHHGGYSRTPRRYSCWGESTRRTLDSLFDRPNHSRCFLSTKSHRCEQV